MEGEHWEAAQWEQAIAEALMAGILMRRDANVEAKDGAMSNDNCSCHAQIVGLSHTDSGLERR